MNRAEIERQLKFLRDEHRSVQLMLANLPSNWLLERSELAIRLEENEAEQVECEASLAVASDAQQATNRLVRVTLRDNERVYGSRGADPQILGDTMSRAGKLVEQIALERLRNRSRGRVGKRTSTNEPRFVPPRQIVRALATGSFGFDLEIEGPETGEDAVDVEVLNDAVDLLTHAASDDDEIASTAIDVRSKSVRVALRNFFATVSAGALQLEVAGRARAVSAESTVRASTRLASAVEMEDVELEREGVFLSANRRRAFEFKPDDPTDEVPQEISGYISGAFSEEDIVVLRGNSGLKMIATFRKTTVRRGDKTKDTWVLLAAAHIPVVPDGDGFGDGRS